MKKIHKFLEKNAALSIVLAIAVIIATQYIMAAMLIGTGAVYAMASLTAYSSACAVSSSGYNALYLVATQDIASVTKAVSGDYSAITMQTSKKFVKVDFQDDDTDGLEYTDVYEGNSNGGYWKKTLKINMRKVDQTSREWISLLLAQSPCGIVALAVANDGQMKVIGWDYNLCATTGPNNRSLFVKTVTSSKGKLLKDFKDFKALELYTEDTDEARNYTGLLSAIT